MTFICFSSHVITAMISASLSIRSPSLYRSRPLWLASIRRHGDPNLNASLAAATALSISSCKVKDVKMKDKETQRRIPGPFRQALSEKLDPRIRDLVKQDFEGVITMGS